MSAAELHKALLETFKASQATVEDVARAWASIDGKVGEFDKGRRDPCEASGHYVGYMAEAEELMRRAISYARSRYAREREK